ncbi:MAG: TolC family protein, partial [Thermoanaerobaculia bacterium]
MRPSPRRPGALLMATALLTGCAAARVQPPVSALVRPDAWESRGGATTRFSSSPAALSGWWSGLGDPTLAGLVERALVASPDVRNARAKVREARARHGLARADYLPSIDASVGFSSSRTGRADATNLFDAGFDASWEPDLWGGTRSAVRAARLELEASEADLDAARVTLAAEVARNYVELRGYQARLDVARQNLASQTETLQLTSWRAQAGLVSTLDVDQARTNVEETRAKIPGLETTRAAAEHRIAVLIGLSPGSLRDELSAPAPVLAI